MGLAGQSVAWACATPLKAAKAARAATKGRSDFMLGDSSF